VENNCFKQGAVDLVGSRGDPLPGWQRNKSQLRVQNRCLGSACFRLCSSKRSIIASSVSEACVVDLPDLQKCKNSIIDPTLPGFSYRI
jgi:hypothetical protein